MTPEIVQLALGKILDRKLTKQIRIPKAFTQFRYMCTYAVSGMIGLRAACEFLKPSLFCYLQNILIPNRILPPFESPSGTHLLRASSARWILNIQRLQGWTVNFIAWGNDLYRTRRAPLVPDGFSQNRVVGSMLGTRMVGDTFSTMNSHVVIMLTIAQCSKDSG